MAGTILAAVLLSFYVIWLIRLAPAYGELSRMTGNITVRFIGLFFLLYVILSAAFLADLLAKVIPQSLISGISGKWLSLLAVAACSLGTHRGMQRRGRIAEISGGIFLAGILLLTILSAGQGKAEYFLETVEGTGSRFSGKWMIRDVYAFLCVFSGVGLLPFGLEKVEKQGSARKPVILAFLTVCGIVLGMQVLLPAVFGKNRLLAETYPVLPLLDGADLPGNVLARFDVIWMGFLVFGLLFSLGSLFHYGNQIAEKTKLGSGRYWIPAAGWILSLYERNGAGIEKYYGWYLAYIFVPLLLVIQMDTFKLFILVIEAAFFGQLDFCGVDLRIHLGDLTHQGLVGGEVLLLEKISAFLQLLCPRVFQFQQFHMAGQEAQHHLFAVDRR